MLLSTVAIGVLVALVSMLAVFLVINQQYLEQSNALLLKASKVIDSSLVNRKDNLLTSSRQLATQKNIGATIWYLAKYAQSNVDRETLFNTYQKLVNDTLKISRAAKASKIAVYDSAGNLVSFALFDTSSDFVGFVERYPSPLFQVATLKDGEELSRDNLRKTNSIAKISFDFGGRLPQQESVHYAVVDGMLSIESFVPIMGEAFSESTGEHEIKQLGLVVMVQPLDQAFVSHLSWLTDTKINVFTSQGFSSGNVAAYRNPDWGVSSKIKGIQDAQAPVLAFNEITIAGTDFYQRLIPLYTDKHLIGTIAVLHSKEIARTNTWEMMQTLGLIAVASLLLILPLAWYFAISIFRPLTLLSHIFRTIATGQHTGMQSDELTQLKKEQERNDELGDLTQSFIVMDDAINQNIKQINEINASLEDKIELRTQELRIANEELTKLAMHDVLTELPNRKLLYDRLQRALIAAKRDKALMALMFIDLDEFKPINDTHGHDIGDLLLQEAAKRIHECIRESDTVSRIGGDEFIVLLSIIEAAHDAKVVAEKICHALNQPFELVGVNLCISSSIGIAIYPEHGSEASALLKNADTAMYYAKASGGNTVRLFQIADIKNVNR